MREAKGGGRVQLPTYRDSVPVYKATLLDNLFRLKKVGTPIKFSVDPGLKRSFEQGQIL